MTEDDRTGHSSTAATGRTSSVLSPVAPRERRRLGLFRRRKRNRRIRWLRLLAILVPLSFLALVSTVFGMVLAFAPQLGPLVKELNTTYKNGLNSIIYSNGYDTHTIGILTSHNQFFLPADRIPLLVDHAIVAIEDKRFYTEPGIDYRGIARAFVADVFHTGGGTQGGSTITEQFVKNALGVEEAKHRTIFNKLREAALAFQLTHLWSKSKILAEYLNTSYFGNGAYGIEAAARAYFGNDPSSALHGCGTAPNVNDPASLCVTYLTADEAALLAGMVSAPTTLGNDLFTDSLAVYDRRNLVLKDMYEQGYLTLSEYQTDSLQSTPPAADIQSPSEEDIDPSAGYFAQWIENQLLANSKYGQSIYSAGYHIHTTLDYGLQQDAQAAVNHILPPGIGGPAAALVAIDNKTGEVTAMVGGYDFSTHPFNLATQAERQPGSAFKVFDLAAALASGRYGYNTPVYSGQYTYTKQAVPFGDFVVHNDEHSYFNGYIPLWEALALSDNSAFARVGLSIGESTIASYAKEFGITTTVSLNPSMVIGGLHIGVTPLDMAHAYETIANYGNLTTGNLASDACAGGAEATFLGPQPTPPCDGPDGIDFISQPNAGKAAVNVPETIPTGFPRGDAATEIRMMSEVIAAGTGSAAQIPGVTEWGKTGTTSNYVDAWFVGSTAASSSAPSMTVAVWVGFPNSGSKSMAKDYGGKPVYGGTYPALIWKAYVTSAIRQYQHEAAVRAAQRTAKRSGHPSGSTAGSGASGASGSAGALGATLPTSPAGATATNAPASGATTPATGTVTSGGGSSAPASSRPTSGATAPAGGSTTPASGTTTPSGGSPPVSTQGGGVTAPGGGTSAPPG
jgi:penicillin-binding protein 1A